MEEPNMLGIMTMPSSYPVLKSTGETVIASLSHGSVRCSGFDITDYVPMGIEGYNPTPESLQTEPYQVVPAVYYANNFGKFTSIPWLMNVNSKDGEAFINIWSKDMTNYCGTDAGSTLYKVLLLDNANREAWGYIGAPGTGGYGAELITAWTESVTGDFDFDTFTTSDSTVTAMEITGTAKILGLAYSNTFAITEGCRYQIDISSTKISGVGDIRIHLGTPSVVGRFVNVVYSSRKVFEFTATANDALQTCLWLYVDGVSSWSTCTFAMKQVSEAVTGDELLTEWETFDDTATPKGSMVTLTMDGPNISRYSATSPQFGDAEEYSGRLRAEVSLVEGKCYRLAIGAVRDSYQPTAFPNIAGGTNAWHGELVIGTHYSDPERTILKGIAASTEYLQSKYGEYFVSEHYDCDWPKPAENYFVFTATANDAIATHLWMNLGGSRWSDMTFSLKELISERAFLGGAHIVSEKNGSTRNWTSIAAGFDFNLVNKMKIMTADAALFTTAKYRIQVRDPSSGKWIRGWIGNQGTEETLSRFNAVESIEKGSNPIIVFDHAGTWPAGYLLKFAGMTQMTEINGLYLTIGPRVGEIVGDHAPFYLMYNTSSFSAAETTGGAIDTVTQPGADGCKVFYVKDAQDNETAKQYWVGETGFIPNRTDYEVYITLER
jgi:hypothetical protein